MDKPVNENKIAAGEAQPADKPGDDRSPEMLRREFLKRFGVYTAGSAIGLYVLMSPGTSAAAGSGNDGDGSSTSSPSQQKTNDSLRTIFTK